MVLVKRIRNSGLWARTPRVVALIGFFKKKVCILYAHSGCGRPFTKTVKIFGKEIDLVLPLVENSSVKIVIA